MQKLMSTYLVVHPTNPLYNRRHLIWRMPMAIKLRALSAEEQDVIEKLAHSRTAAARLVERARIILLASQGHWVPAIAHQLQLTAITVRTWLKRFNAAGLAALTDKPRSGRPATYTPQQVAEVIATALTPPEHLGLPFASWTLDRLAAYLHKHPGIAINPAAFDRHLCLFVEERREPIQRPARAWLIELLWVRQRGRDDLRDLLRLRRDRPSGPRPILQTSEASRIEVFE